MAQTTACPLRADDEDGAPFFDDVFDERLLAWYRHTGKFIARINHRYQRKKNGGHYVVKHTKVSPVDAGTGHAEYLREVREEAIMAEQAYRRGGLAEYVVFIRNSKHLTDSRYIDGI